MAKRSACKVHPLPILTVFFLVALVAFVAWRVRREGFSDGSNKAGDNAYTMVYVYSSSCTYCNQFDPVWNQFQEQVQAANLSNIKLEKSTDATKYGVKAFPTVLLLENNKNKATFKGERTTEELWNFLRANMKPT